MLDNSYGTREIDTNKDGRSNMISDRLRISVLLILVLSSTDQALETKDCSKLLDLLDVV